MSIDPAITAIATLTGALAGYGIKLVELHLNTRSQRREANTSEKKTILDGYNELTQHLQTRVAALESQIDDAHKRLADAFDRIERLERQNHKLTIQLATISTQLAQAYHPKGT